MFYPISLEAIAVPSPSTPSTPPGDVEARYRVLATFVLRPLIDSDQTFVAWAACVASSRSGSGEAYVSGMFGGYGAGDACDFAHSRPLTSGSAILGEDLTLDAIGNSVLDVTVTFRFFDAAGNSPIARFSLVETPEPAAAFPMAFALCAAGLCVALRRSTSSGRASRRQSAHAAHSFALGAGSAGCARPKRQPLTAN